MFRKINKLEYTLKYIDLDITSFRNELKFFKIFLVRYIHNNSVFNLQPKVVFIVLFKYFC